MIGAKPFTRSVYWTLVEAERKQEAAVAAAPGVNHDVLTFGFKRLQSHAHDIVRAKFVQKKQKEEDKDKRKRLAAEVSAGRLVKYARVADGAKAKLMAVGNKVIHAKLLNDELVAALRNHELGHRHNTCGTGTDRNLQSSVFNIIDIVLLLGDLSSMQSQMCPPRLLTQRQLILLLGIQAIGTLIYFQHLTQDDGLDESGNYGFQKHGRDIRAVAFDRGGWNAMEPVLQLAFLEGWTVHVLLGGASARQLRDGLLSPNEHFAVTAVLADGATSQVEVQKFVAPAHTATLIAASQSAEGSDAAATGICNSSARPLLLQDMYGVATATLATVADRCATKASQVVATVGDAVSRQHLEQQLPDFPGSVVVTGAPQFDWVAALIPELPKHRMQLRAQLGIADDEQLILIAGQPRGTNEMLEMLEQAIALEMFRVRVILRLHPRTASHERDRVAMLRDRSAPGRFVDAQVSRYPSTESLLPAVDVVMSGFSTTNYFGILMGIPGVVYAGEISPKSAQG
ncbi:hypothetical protein CYMTET_50821 [Cymbomonas tetramitiformis]|uniref:Uncharacterized protein n=1 Tax=Cymbomonas tetramitiformis TaxID=36881 RepID=A0AAE0BMI0_9CHLO|nr:hypothetical protein CYMTET_50821 [Cymbomonas tetramitiformis]